MFTQRLRITTLAAGSLFAAVPAQVPPASVWDDTDIVHLVGLDDGRSHNVMPTVSPDELTMLFASDRAGGAGGFDLYMATRTSVSARWGSVASIPGINTAADEMHNGAWFGPGGAIELFFVREGAARSDVWTARRRPSGAWTSPVRLGSEVNGRGIFNAYLDVTYDGTLATVARRTGGAGRNARYLSYELERVQVGSSFRQAILLPAVHLRSSASIELFGNGDLGLFRVWDRRALEYRWVLGHVEKGVWEVDKSTPKLAAVIDCEVGAVTGRLYECHPVNGRMTLFHRRPLQPWTSWRPHDGVAAGVGYIETVAVNDYYRIVDLKLGTDTALMVQNDHPGSAGLWGVAMRLTNTPIVFGDPRGPLLLDLRLFVFLGRTQADAAGTHVLPVPLPNHPSLDGVGVYVQAVTANKSTDMASSPLMLQLKK